MKTYVFDVRYSNGVGIIRFRREVQGSLVPTAFHKIGRVIKANVGSRQLPGCAVTLIEVRA